MNTKVLNKYFLFVSFFFSESHFCIESVAQSLLCIWESQKEIDFWSNIFPLLSCIVLSPQTYKAKGNLYLCWCLLYSSLTSSLLSFKLGLSVLYITYDFIFSIFLNLISFINFSDFSPRLQLISQIFDFISSYKLWKKWKEIGFNENYRFFSYSFPRYYLPINLFDLNLLFTIIWNSVKLIVCFVQSVNRFFKMTVYIIYKRDPK